MNLLTRDQAINIMGESFIQALDNEPCDYTNSITPDGLTEFASIAYGTPLDTADRIMAKAIYYQPNELIEAVEDAGKSIDTELDWVVAGYKIPGYSA
jgi:hypothetical protein